MLRLPFLCALLLLSSSGATLRAQSMALLPGTTMEVMGGTTVRLLSPVQWQVQAGSTVLNDGMIELAPAATISEAVGSPIEGAGTERIQRTYGTALVNEQPGGLGLQVSTVVAPGTITLERGHAPILEPGGQEGIGRWFRWSADVNTGLDATAAFAYDPVQLNGVAEADQVLHVLQANSYWLAIPSSVNTSLDRVEASGLDSLGFLTTFAGALTTGIAERVRAEGAVLVPTLADVAVQLIALPADRERALEVYDASGKRVLDLRLPAGARRITMDVSALAPGIYAVRLHGDRELRFVRA